MTFHDVVIVGAGPAGLAAAIGAREAGADDILILHGTKDEVVPFEDSQKFADEQLIEFIPIEKADHRFRQYYLAFGLIAAVIVIDMVEIFFKGSNEQIVRDVFGCVVMGIVGMAVSAGVWYLQAKKGKSDE